MVIVLYIKVIDVICNIFYFFLVFLYLLWEGEKFFFLREFQLIVSTPNNSYLLSDQNINWFLM